MRRGYGVLARKLPGLSSAPEQHLQQMQRAAGLKTVGMRGDTAHRVHRNRAADHLVVRAAVHVGPADRQFDRLLERDLCHFQREAGDRLGRNAALCGHALGRIAIVEIAFGREAEDGLGTATVGKFGCRVQRRRDVGQIAVDQLLHVLVPDQRLAVGAAREQAVAREPRRLHDQPRRVGVADQKLPIDEASLEQHVDERECQQAVGAGPDRHPFVGDRGIARSHRIDGHELGPAFLELFEADLDRVRGVVLGDTPQQEILRVVPVGRTEFPERVADRVQAGDGHVHRAEAAMCRPVRRAELLRPQAGQRLHLVAAGEKGELRGIGRPDSCQARRQQVQRFVPLDLDEVAGAAFAAGTALQRFRQFRRRILLHDSGGAFGTQHAAVYRVIEIPLDEAHALVLDRDLDPAAACAHVARAEIRLLLGAVVEGYANGHCNTARAST